MNQPDWGFYLVIEHAQPNRMDGVTLFSLEATREFSNRLSERIGTGIEGKP